MHITYRYIDSSRHNLENCVPSQFVYQSYLGRQLAALLDKGALRYKLWEEAIFKICAQQFNVYVCNVDCHLLVCKIRQPVNCLFRLPLPPKEA